jgi:hypothetical protein
MNKIIEKLVKTLATFPETKEAYVEFTLNYNHVLSLQ